MRIETLAIGDELLDGRLADTNSQRFARHLADRGLSLQRSTVIDDDVDRIRDAVRAACARADLVVTSGGLGPTTDDLTAEGVAAANNEDIRLDAPSFAHIKKLFASKGFDMPDINRRQAEVPASATILRNGAGVAPGFLTLVDDAKVVSLPGVPREFDHLIERHVLPLLPDVEQGAAACTRTLRCVGVTESQLGATLEPLLVDVPHVKVQYRTSFPENLARLRFVADDAAAAQALADDVVARARTELGGGCYAVSDDSLAALTVGAFVDKGLTFGTAESCTGGLIGAAITDVSGASSMFEGGILSYSNAIKMNVLGVANDTLAAHGAVSEETAREMATGARRVLGVDYAVAVTGIAGPGGGTDAKPVGTVCFGLAGPDGVHSKRRLLPFGSRERIRQMTVAVALKWALTTVQATDPS